MYLGELGVIYRLKVLKVKWFASRRQSDKKKRYVCEWGQGWRSNDIILAHDLGAQSDR